MHVIPSDKRPYHLLSSNFIEVLNGYGEVDTIIEIKGAFTILDDSLNTGKEFEVRGLKGKSVKLVYNSDTLDVFSGALSKMPLNIFQQFFSVPKVESGWFYNHGLKYCFSSRNQLYKNEEGVYIQKDGEYTNSWIYKFSKGFTLDFSEGWEWGHRAVILDSSKFSAEEAYLLAISIFDESLKVDGVTLNADGIVIIPDSSFDIRADAFSRLEIQHNGKIIEKIISSYGEGCFEDRGMEITSEGHYRIYSSFGC